MSDVLKLFAVGLNFWFRLTSLQYFGNLKGVQPLHFLMQREIFSDLV